MYKYSFLIIICWVAQTATSQPLEEFCGPFQSWCNIKDVFHATGDGKTDDTNVFQKAIDQLNNPLVDRDKRDGKSYMVLFLPKGEYCISSTLVLRGKIGITIIGEDPEKTSIKWIGSNSDTIFWADGSAYFKLSRLTWQANGKKNMEAIGIHWINRWKDSKSQSFASLNIEVSDNRFLGGFEYGINGGTSPQTGTGDNDSEVTIKRCLFDRCSKGINIAGYNALDYWIWDSKFIECNIGINNAYGNFHAYRCYFEKSTASDIMQTAGYYTSVRGCYSNRSKAFSIDQGGSSNPFKRVFQGNFIISPLATPIEYYHIGKITMIDNFVDSCISGGSKVSIKTGSWAPANFEILSLNNLYRHKTPIQFLSSPSHLYSFGDNFSDFSSAYVDREKFLSQMEKYPDQSKRDIIEVPANASHALIEQLILKACQRRPSIVHFPIGQYIVEKPIVIPARANVHIIGDGLVHASVITPASTFPFGQAILKIEGPSLVVIKDIQFGSFNDNEKNINGVEFSGIDQKESRAFIDQLYTNSKETLLAKNIDYLYIQKDNSFFSVGSQLVGGKLTKNKKGKARVHCFGGQFANVNVSNGIAFVAKDCWWEGSERTPLLISGAGNITIDGVMIAPNKADSIPSIIVNSFKGRLNLSNAYVYGSVKVNEDNRNLNLMLWNIHFYHALQPYKFSSFKHSFQGKYSFLGLTTQCFDQNDSHCAKINTVPNKEFNVANTSQFFSTMMEDDRNAVPLKYLALSDKSSNFLISRVSFGGLKKSLIFQK